MVRKGSFIAAIVVAIVIAITIAAKAQQSSNDSQQPGSDQSYYGNMPCYGGQGYGHMMGYGGGMGPAMMGEGWMGPGMMGYGPGYGMGPGMMGGGYGSGARQAPADLNLTVNQVRKNMERWVRRNGNPHLKVGNVVQKDNDTITADIVTTDKDAIVERYEVNRHTGYFQPAE